jgi:hypothetical protein
MDDEREELKQELEKLGPRGRGRPYPKLLLGKLLSYTVARRRQGAKVAEVAAELGMKFQTLSRWIGEQRPTKRFERVEVIAPRVESKTRALIVRGPGGICVEGLDLDGVIELMRRVAE